MTCILWLSDVDLFYTQMLYKVIEVWSTALYNPQVIINAVEVSNIINLLDFKVVNKCCTNAISIWISLLLLNFVLWLFLK